jgi:hypothetical protein
MHRTWAEAQTAFAAALVDPSLPPPPGIIQCGGSGQRRGFAVYRNNSLVTLIDALQERFPVTCQLVGQEFFRAMARAYASDHRPRSPLLMHYGDAFPTFIDAFAPAGDFPYLSDVARLEAAWSEAYHAPEARSLTPQVLANARPEGLAETGLMLHPSIRLLRSTYPVADIWAAHQHSNTPAAPKNWDGQDILIVRPDAEVVVHTLAPGAYALISALLDGRHIQHAVDLASIGNPEFDAGANIVNLFGLGAVVALGTAETQEVSTWLPQHGLCDP